jgi:signal transduction histidine kinase
VLPNNVVAPVSLPHWSITSHLHVYQWAVVAVNDHPVRTPTEVYRIVRSLPPSSTVTYTLKKDGQTLRVPLLIQVFTLKDYLLLFGAYFLTGLVIIFVGIGAWVFKPGTPAGLALFITTFAVGLFFLTAADLYAPDWFFRLHVLSEALLAAGFLHLALVFSVDWTSRARPFLLSLPYLVAFVLAVAYQLSLYQPTSYLNTHSLCEMYAGLSGLSFLGIIVRNAWAADSPLVRRRNSVIFLGFLGGFGLPAAFALLTRFTGGEVTVNYAVFTAALLPLSLGYVTVRHDFFEIDTLLKRSIYYLTLTVMLTLGYFVFLSILNLTLQSSGFARSQVFSLLFTLLVALLLNPLKERLQRAVDRVFFRLHYNAEKILETTSAALASTLYLEEILSLVTRVIGETMGVTQVRVFLLDKGCQKCKSVSSETGEVISIPAALPLVQKLRQHKRILTRDDAADQPLNSISLREQWGDLAAVAAQLFVPLCLKDELLGFIAINRKESGWFFSTDDRDFLSALANQSALSIANALSYDEIAELNAGLEQKTQELARTNAELQHSFTQLEHTYSDLQRSQENLVRSEKMAALGRLTAGFAHEMNTPLGASLNSLKSLDELIAEYESSIGDASVTDEDHREIASDMHAIVRLTRQWIEKASAHIRSFKLHTRDLPSEQQTEFSVVQVIEDTRLLLAHRLRLSQCTLNTSCSSTTPSVHGDPSKLGQVLTNVIVNAIDAYKGTGKDKAAIDITVSDLRSDRLEIRVRDYACGIPPENFEKIFHELFSTKPMGEGTGLGLAICRDIMTNLFSGSIDVESTVGQGTTVILRLPRKRTGGTESTPTANASTPYRPENALHRAA